MSESIFSASPRVIRPRLTASSTTSWSRSRLRVTLRSRLARNSSTLLSRPVVLERPADFRPDFAFAFAFDLAFFGVFGVLLFLAADLPFADLAFFDLPEAVFFSATCSSPDRVWGWDYL